jgi:DNA-binding CsgD family transcriptional regulator
MLYNKVVLHSNKMMLFNNPSSTASRSWIGLRDVELRMRKEWEWRFRCSGVPTDTNKFIRRIVGKSFMQRLEKHRLLMDLVSLEINACLSNFVKRHVFAYIDADEVILDFYGTETITRMLNKYNVQGVSCSMEDVGLSAVSIAKQTARTAVVVGAEHSLQLLSEIMSVCVPIHVDGKIASYLCLVLGVNEDVEFAVALTEQLVKQIENKIHRGAAAPSAQQIESHFDKYGLSLREKEVASRWLHNQTTVQISSTLYITEGTVRNMIKKIYKKTNVKGRAQFISKFLVQGTVELLR